jgi:hypothetical protein
MEPTAVMVRRKGRVLERGLGVAAFVLLVVTLAFDAAVRTAYNTDWLRPADDARRAADKDPFTFCDRHRCPRLPDTGLTVLYVVVAVLAVVVVAVAIWRWAVGVAGGSRTPVAVLALAAGVVGIASGVARLLAAEGAGPRAVDWSSRLSVLAVLLAAAAVIVTANQAARNSGTQMAPALRHLIRGQRFALIVIVLYAVALLLLGQTSGQALDELRTWSFGSSPAAWVKPALGVASALLLALVVYESGIRLDVARPQEHPVTWRAWLVVLGVLVAADVVLSVLLAQVLWGLVVLAVLVALLTVAEAVHVPLGAERTDAAGAPLRGREARTVIEWLATLPLAIIAAAAAVAGADELLAGRSVWAAAGPLVGAFALVGASMTLVEPEPEAYVRPAPRMTVPLVTVGLGSVMVAAGGWVAATGAWIALAGAVWLALFVSWGWTDTRRPGLSLLLAPLIGVVVFVFVLADVQGAARLLGATTFVNIALAAALAWLHWMAVGGLRYRPPRLLHWFGFRDLPVLTLVVVWWVLAGVVVALERPELHDARVLAAAPAGAAPTLDAAFKTWANSQHGGPGPVPLVLVASDGGGIRAAYWTALVLDCLVRAAPAGPLPSATCAGSRDAAAQRRAAGRVFLASGVSGGGVGFGAYARQLLAGGLAPGWVDARLGHDFASPTVGWALFHDLPDHLLGAASRPGGACAAHLFGGACLTQDRAAVLEETFDRVWPARGAQIGLRGAWASRAQSGAPLLVINATANGGHERVNVSAANLSAWPSPEDAGATRPDPTPLAGSRDAVDLLCSASDLRVSTAALLGARFPYVSPSGRLSGSSCADGRSAVATPCGAPCATSMVDGGYADNTGLLTIDTLWPALRRLVVAHNAVPGAVELAPVIVEIDNHYQAPGALLSGRTKTSFETVVPPATAFGVHGFIEGYAREQALHLAGRDCVLTLSPALHPGLTAPLGWALSDATREELRQALTRATPTWAAAGVPHATLVAALRRLQQWLSAPHDRSAAAELRACVPR